MSTLNDKYDSVDNAVVTKMFNTIRSFEAKHALLQDMDDKKIVTGLTSYIEREVKKILQEGDD